MKKELDAFVLEDSDIGFPRFTTLRRRLEEYEGFAYEIYNRFCSEFDIKNPLPLHVDYFIQQGTVRSAYATYWTNSEKQITDLCVRISVVNAKLHDEEIYNNALPHEMGHIFQALFDLDLFRDDGHGQLWSECCQWISRQFPYVSIKSGFPIKDWDGYVEEISQMCQTFKIE